eukprot:344297-Rhodomonas_salina.2
MSWCAQTGACTEFAQLCSSVCYPVLRTSSGLFNTHTVTSALLTEVSVALCCSFTTLLSASSSRLCSSNSTSTPCPQRRGQRSAERGGAECSKSA